MLGNEPRLGEIKTLTPELLLSLRSMQCISPALFYFCTWLAGDGVCASAGQYRSEAHPFLPHSVIRLPTPCPGKVPRIRR